MMQTTTMVSQEWKEQGWQGLETWRYPFLEEKGRGGWGIIYKVYDRWNACEVALKTVTRDAPYKLRACLQREAALLSSLKHPNILACLDQGMLPDGRPYYTMPLVEGSSLEDVLQAGRLSTHESLSILKQLQEVIRYTHARGIVHCDIKPENILCDAQGRLFLIDWGCAESEAFPMPRSHQEALQYLLKGTPLYIAPEQIIGKELTPAADLYSLGVILYRMLSGRFPFFEEDIRSLFAKVCCEEPPAFVCGVSSPLRGTLEELCLRLLSKRPEARQNAFRVLATLRGFSNTEAKTLTARLLSRSTLAHPAKRRDTSRQNTAGYGSVQHGKILETRTPDTLQHIPALNTPANAHALPLPSHQVEPPTPARPTWFAPPLVD